MLSIYLWVVLASGGTSYEPQGPIGKAEILIAAGLDPAKECARIMAYSAKERMKLTPAATKVTPYCIYTQ